MSVEIVISGQEVNVTTNQNVADSYDLTDFTNAISSISEIRQASVYAGRDTEAEALTPVVGSNTPVNHGATFSTDGFTGDGSSAYIDSDWSPSNEGVWSTQMWCGWVKDIGDGGIIMGLADYDDPNYASFSITSSYSSSEWSFSPYTNSFVFEKLNIGTSNNFDASDESPKDLFFVYQWNGSNVELWINGRLALSFSNAGSTETTLNAFELAQNYFGSGQFDYSNATLGFSAYGTAMSRSDIETLYESVKNYIGYAKAGQVIGGTSTVNNSDESYSGSVTAGDTLVLPDITITKNDDTTTTQPSVKNLDLGVIDPFPSTWSEMVAEYGIGYSYTPPTGLTTSYRTGDDYWVEQNIIGPARAADALKPKNTLVTGSFTTLVNNNAFGNTNRFTDENGLQVYGNNYIIDHITGIAYCNDDLSADTWNNLIDAAVASAYLGYEDWFLANVNQIISVSNQGVTTNGLNYSPFNMGRSNVYIHTSTTNTLDTTRSLQINYDSTPLLQLEIIQSFKASSRYGVMCRKHY